VKNRPEKLQRLLDRTGAPDVWEILRRANGDAVAPGICMNEDCNYIVDVEPDQRRGYCDECDTNTVKSALILAGLV
jgi:hypothetical protein